MSDLSNASDQPTRSKWRKRLIISAILILGVGSLGWLVWSWLGADATRPLLEEMARISAAGEPIYPEDFDRDPVADEENAYLFAMAAAEALAMRTSVGDLTDWAKPFDLEKAGQFVCANEEALALVRKARGMTGCDSGLRMRLPLVNSFPACVRNINRLRQLTKTVCVAAKWHHQIGDDLQATELLRDAVRIGRIAETNGVILNHLVAIALDSLTYSCIEEICYSLQVSDSGSPDGLATRRQVEALISELLDEEQLREATVRCYQVERAWNADVALSALRGDAPATASPGGAVMAVLLRPVLKEDAVTSVRRGSSLVEAVGQDNWPAASGTLPEAPDGPDWLARLRNPLSGSVGALNNAVRMRYLVLAMRRMAAIALGVRLYEIDCGVRPAELAELVGEYLPAIPADPFAADGRVISYLPGPARPILYSIGRNGIDDHGKYADDPEDWPDPDYDVPFFLDGNRPHGKPEGEPATASRPPS